MTFVLRGAALSITSNDILRATRDASPTPIDGRNKYFLELHGRRFPIKQVVRLVTGLPSIGFTAQDAHRILTRLGFDVFEDPVRVARQTPEPRDTCERRFGFVRRFRELRTRTTAKSEDCWWCSRWMRTAGRWRVAPALPGCHSQGRTREEVLDNVREAIRGYLASLREHDAALPQSSEYPGHRGASVGRGAAPCSLGRRLRDDSREDRILPRSNGR